MTLKISVITTTCRPNPRLDLMARTLAASFRLAPGDLTLEWQVIDQSLLAIDMGGDAAVGARTERFNTIAIPFAELAEPAAGAEPRVTLSLRAVPGASFLTPAKLRNAALECASGDYVVFLDDCTVVTKNFLGTAAACAAEKGGRGWRVRSYSLHDHPIPADGKLRYRDSHSNFSIVPATTVGGACWGAPRDAIKACGGFDEAYDGELKHNQQELIIRLARAGVTFVTCARANVITLRRTHIELVGREAYVGIRNTLMFNGLQRDRGRRLPGGIQVRDIPPDDPDAFANDETPVADVGDDSAPRALADRAPTAPVALPGLPPTPPPGVPRSVERPAVAPRPPRPASPGPIARARKPAAKVVGYIGPAATPPADPRDVVDVIDTAGLPELDGLDGDGGDDDFLDGLEGQLEAMEGEGGKAPDADVSP